MSKYRIAVVVTSCDPHFGAVDSIAYPLQLTPASSAKLESILKSVADSSGYSGWSLTVIEELEQVAQPDR